DLLPAAARDLGADAGRRHRLQLSGALRLDAAAVLRPACAHGLALGAGRPAGDACHRAAVAAGFGESLATQQCTGMGKRLPLALGPATADFHEGLVSANQPMPAFLVKAQALGQSGLASLAVVLPVDAFR